MKITEYSNPTDHDQFGALILKMSKVAYITDTSQLMQSGDWVDQRMTCSMLFNY